MDLTSEGCQADSSEASSSIKCSCQDKINSRPGHALLCQCVSTLTRRHHCCRVWKRVFCKQIIHCILCLGFLAESISSFGDDVCCVDRCHLGKNFNIEVFTFFFFFNVRTFKFLISYKLNVTKGLHLETTAQTNHRVFNSAYGSYMTISGEKQYCFQSNYM